MEIENEDANATIVENNEPVLEESAVDEGAAAEPAAEEPALEASAEEGSEEGAAAEGEGEQEETQEGEAEEGAEGEGEEEAEAYKPNLVYKAGVYNKDTKQLEQKEFNIDPKFAALMTDPDSEKMVRELHEKATGLDSVKERLVETRSFANEVVRENTDIKNSIGTVKKIYNSAVKSGNWLKLDDFFGMLDIPPENILKYALAKVELNEMAPEQRNAILNQLESEKRTEQLTLERDQAQQESVSLARQQKTAQVDFVLAKPEVAALAAEFDKRTGKPGAFKEAVFYEGSKAWSGEGVDLPAAEAVERVIKTYGLTGVGGAAQPQAQTPASPGKTAGAKNTTTIVKRNSPTIPNIGSRSSSPLPAKPKTMEEVMKYRKEVHGF